MKEFRDLEFSKKLRKASTTRMKGYEDIKVSEGVLVYYQYKNMKAWLGPAKLFATNDNGILIFTNANIRKVRRCNVQLCEKEIENDNNKEEKKGTRVQFE